MNLQTVKSAILNTYSAAIDKVKSITNSSNSDDSNAYQFELAVPGLNKNDIDIEVQNDCLIVSAAQELQAETNFKRSTRRQYAYTAFRRVFQLPHNADPSRISARMKNGVLCIQVAELHDHDGYMKLIPVR